MAKYVVKTSVNGAALAALKGLAENKAKLRRCADAALDYQKATCPVDSRALEKSLGIRENSDGSLDIGSVLPSINQRTKQDARDYSLYVEMGHRSRAGNWVPAQPFIRPSLDAAKRGLK